MANQSGRGHVPLQYNTGPQPTRVWGVGAGLGSTLLYTGYAGPSPFFWRPTGIEPVTHSLSDRCSNH